MTILYLSPMYKMLYKLSKGSVTSRHAIISPGFCSLKEKKLIAAVPYNNFHDVGKDNHHPDVVIRNVPVNRIPSDKREYSGTFFSHCNRRRLTVKFQSFE